ncbi:TB2/DP1, HVA22 family-domain-containing protein [Halteromyces radiatus]|uniref:TB2/DP1, HVA22 family-domain-containing protein n=1 Tax=Halteromyces radiatus TaxID=101107 RepID=UPI002220420E|nr:TB2/DP1, HVA22 family-domain-containing protein [Halteromyces radiatus]KAI8082889.1 TB2/DP1, HVA22 family-domain-containing protein [Halteromyces radiatus]
MASSIQSAQVKFQHYLSTLDKELGKSYYMNQVERRTGVPKSYFALGVGGIAFIMIFFNIAGQLLTNVISWIYPAYASFKAIESPGNNDDKQWLTYWTVIGFVQLLEYFSDILLYWFPFYYLFKTLFVLYLVLPQFRGAELLYGRFLRPVLLNTRNSVDKHAHELKEKVHDLASSASKSD